MLPLLGAMTQCSTGNVDVPSAQLYKFSSYDWLPAVTLCYFTLPCLKRGNKIWQNTRHVRNSGAEIHILKNNISSSVQNLTKEQICDQRADSQFGKERIPLPSLSVQLGVRGVCQQGKKNAKLRARKSTRAAYMASTLFWGLVFFIFFFSSG